LGTGTGNSMRASASIKALRVASC